MSNDVTHAFTPFWLFSLEQQQRDDVQQWLTDAGLDLNRCPGFDYDGSLITTRYYARNEMGEQMVNEQGDFIYEHQVIEYPASNPPDAVKERMHGA